VPEPCRCARAHWRRSHVLALFRCIATNLSAPARSHVRRNLTSVHSNGFRTMSPSGLVPVFAHPVFPRPLFHLRLSASCAPPSPCPLVRLHFISIFSNLPFRSLQCLACIQTLTRYPSGGDSPPGDIEPFPSSFSNLISLTISHVRPSNTRK
jgi:hypothetical protein